MIEIDIDLFFKDKVMEFYNIETQSIFSRIEKSRIKMYTLDEIRRENEIKRVDLFMSECRGQLLPDSFRFHIMTQFDEIFKQNSENPVNIFIKRELPKIRLEDEHDYLRFGGKESNPHYDIKFLRESNKYEIIELIAKSFVLNQIWYQSIDFIKEVDNEKYKELLDGFSPNIFSNNVFTDLFDFRRNLKLIFKLKKVLTGTVEGNLRSKGRLRLILKIESEISDDYLNKLHLLLSENGLVEISVDDFKLHFTSQNYKCMKWYGGPTKLATLINALEIRNKNINKDICDHFRDENGNPFDKHVINQERFRMKSTPSLEIEDIMKKMKKSFS